MRILRGKKKKKEKEKIKTVSAVRITPMFKYDYKQKCFLIEALAKEHVEDSFFSERVIIEGQSPKGKTSQKVIHCYSISIAFNKRKHKYEVTLKVDKEEDDTDSLAHEEYWFRP